MSNKTTETKNKFELIFEIILNYAIRYRIIILASIASIVIIVTAIGIYQVSVQNADKQLNIDFESAMLIYDTTKRRGLGPEGTVNAATSIQKVIKNSKGKTLKLRASYALGLLYYDIKNYAEAQKYLKTVSDSRGFYLAESASYSLANTYIEQAKYDDALKQLENNLQLYPDGYLKAENALAIADIHVLKGNRELAITTLKNWIQNNKDDEVYISLFAEALSLIESNIY